MRTRMLAVAGAALGLVGVASFATPSYAAGQDVIVWTTDDNSGGKANFGADKDTDEWFHVCDYDSDGYRASGTVTWSGGSYRLDDADGANGKCAYSPDSWNIPEETAVTVKICLRNGYSGTPKFCKSGTGRA